MTIQLPDGNWLKVLDAAFQCLLASKPLAFSQMTPSRVPTSPGVYLITALLNGGELPYYVGRSKNLQQRLYNNHLMGPISNARLKKYLIDSGECADINAAKEFIRSTCIARWIEESDMRRRGAIEGYVTGLLIPKYGIFEEH